MCNDYIPHNFPAAIFKLSVITLCLRETYFDTSEERGAANIKHGAFAQEYIMLWFSTTAITKTKVKKDGFDKNNQDFFLKKQQNILILYLILINIFHLAIILFLISVLKINKMLWK